MRVIVEKPRNGKALVVVDDRNGATGKRTVLGRLAKEDLEATVGPVLADWEATRRRIREARKGPKP